MMDVSNHVPGLKGDGKGCEDVCMSDRMIPSRLTCNALSQMKLENDENWAPQNDYQEVLSQNVLGAESLANIKVLSYKHKPQRQEPGAAQSQLQVLYSSNRTDPGARPRPAARVLPQSALKVLDAPNIVDDFYSHPVDWSARNIVAVALSSSVYLYNVSSAACEELLTLKENEGCVTNLRWTPDGEHLAIGVNTGEVQLWRASTLKQVRSLKGHSGRIGALAWYEHILSSGAQDAEVHHHDVRAKDHLVNRLIGAHADLVCGLDYNSDGVLASGGNDNGVCIWDSIGARTPVHVLTEHQAAVKAVKWCPFQRNVLATGGGTADRQVCLWNAMTGRLLMSADAESQVTGVLWGAYEKELLTAHGFSRNQLSLWKYPALVKMGEIEGHAGRILGITQSPCGSLICSSSADETLRFWRVFTPGGTEKKAQERAAPNPILKMIR